MRVIATHDIKGGVGKPSAAVNVACQAEQPGRSRRAAVAGLSRPG